MDELLRLQYLDAMGVTQYVARAPLPGARPSAIVEIELPTTTNAAMTDVAALLPERQPQHKLHTAAHNPPSHQHILETAAATPITRKTAPPTRTATIEKSQDTFQCRIAIWTVDDLLILADCTRLDNEVLTLLRNILQAIGRSTELSPAQQFVWPLQQRKEKSQHAAREYFQGLLDAGPLQNISLRQILAFGEHAAALLQTDPASTHHYHDRALVSACSLRDMLEQPLRKRETWKTLQVLLRT